MMCVSIGPASASPVMSSKENSEIACKCMYTDPKNEAFFYTNALDVQQYGIVKSLNDKDKKEMQPLRSIFVKHS